MDHGTLDTNFRSPPATPRQIGNCEFLYLESTVSLFGVSVDPKCLRQHTPAVSRSCESALFRTPLHVCAPSACRLRCPTLSWSLLLLLAALFSASEGAGIQCRQPRRVQGCNCGACVCNCGRTSFCLLLLTLVLPPPSLPHYRACLHLLDTMPSDSVAYTALLRNWKRFFA